LPLPKADISDWENLPLNRCSSDSEAGHSMRDPVKKPVRRTDVREPLEKLSLLSIKEPGKSGAETGRTKKTARRPRPDRWM
jgi:hypothetical protein